MNAFSKITDILIVAFILFIAPIQYYAIKTDNINQTAVTTDTAMFTDTIRNKGFIDKEMYNQFIAKLQTTGNVYNVEINHYKKIYNYDKENEKYTMDYEFCGNDLILDTLDKGQYRFEMGDFVCVKVISEGFTKGEKIRNTIMGTNIKSGINVNYGGVIRDEAY